MSRQLILIGITKKRNLFYPKISNFSDPKNAQRTANHLSWCGNEARKLAVSYCNLEFQSKAKSLSDDSYIWDIGK
jgi:hypothetical protein